MLVLLTVLGPLIFSAMIQFSESVSSLGDFLEATDAGLQMLLLLGGSIAFLVTWESRTCLRDCRASEFWNYREQR